MTGNVIFIAGVHGVGKGTLAQQVSREAEISCFSASDLIRERKQAPVDHQKNVIGAEQNQDYLVSVVLEKSATQELLILDGHFTLWRDQEIFSIPMTVFRDLPLMAIILVQEPPEIVYSRLAARDGSSKPIEQIAEALRAEADRATLVQQNLRVPMLTVNSSQVGRVSDWIRELTRKHQ